uniref:Uncharacterized protein n=1 Tax=Sphaeramia orbicularis TaxID=375764 RepID=A0A673C6U1_9TELE
VQSHPAAALPSCSSPPGNMAAPAVARSSGPALCPSFAVVCSFLERYGAVLDLPEMSFPQMERYLRDTSAGKSPAAVPVGRRRRSGAVPGAVRPVGPCDGLSAPVFMKTCGGSHDAAAPSDRLAPDCCQV